MTLRCSSFEGGSREAKQKVTTLEGEEHDLMGETDVD